LRGQAGGDQQERNQVTRLGLSATLILAPAFRDRIAETFDGGFGLRRAFEAACRLAGGKPKILFESRAPHTLLALAEAGHGVAIIGSAFRTHRYDLQIVRVTYRGQPLREPLTVLWDKRRPLPRDATTFCEMWAKHVREAFPITRPSEPKDTARKKRPASRRARDALP